MRKSTKKWAKRKANADNPRFLAANGITREQYVSRFNRQERICK